MANKQKNQLNIYKEFWKLAHVADDIAKTGRYDVDMLISAWEHLLNQTLYFYKNLVNKTGNPDVTYYALKNEPAEHQLVYCQLGRGYSKELYDPHWCYLYKHCGAKLFIIPVTSIKPTTSPNHHKYEFDIEENDGKMARMHFDDIRCIDKMRVAKDYYIDVKTTRTDIEKAMANFLCFSLKDVDKEEKE